MTRRLTGSGAPSEPASAVETGRQGEDQEGSTANADRRFWLALAAAVAVGAAVRILYLVQWAPAFPLGDGFSYHLQALRIADGLGYTSPAGDTGAELAHHPPGWVTVLAGVTGLGGRSLRAHQATGLVIGLGVVAVTGLVGRRYAGRRVGVIAAVLAAIYPGFWVLDVQILSEPLGLLVVGLFTLVLADLWQRPTVARSVLTGAVAGALALVRSEQLAVFLITLAPILLFNRRITIGRRIGWTAAATATAAVVIAPWAVYNLTRFEEPVFLSTNGGSTLLSGNCPPETYSGELIGFHDNRCLYELGLRARGLDRSETDIKARDAAFDNMRDNLDRLPVTTLARYGRTFAVFRPSQTVEDAAAWFGSTTWPVWAWVTSVWLLLPLAGYGSVLLRRSRIFQWPLVAPLVVALVVITVAYGEPRYHTPADLGIVVLAAVTLERVSRRAAERWGWSS